MLKIAFWYQKLRFWIWAGVSAVGAFVMTLLPYWLDQEILSKGFFLFLNTAVVLVLVETLVWAIIKYKKEDAYFVVTPDGKVRKKDIQGKPIYTIEELLDEKGSTQHLEEGNDPNKRTPRVGRPDLMEDYEDLMGKYEGGGDWDVDGD